MSTSFIEYPVTELELEKCYQLQRMNYLVSQLPGSAKCPPAPYLGDSRSLPIPRSNKDES